MNLFLLLDSPLIPPIAPASLALGIFVVDNVVFFNHTWSYLGIILRAFAYGALISFSFIRYRTALGSIQVDKDGYVVRSRKVVKRVQYVHRSDSPSPSATTDISLNPSNSSESAWPADSELGWTPFQSLPYKKARGSGAASQSQHFWSKGRPAIFNLRSIGYKASKVKEPSKFSLYDCVGVDLVRADKMITVYSQKFPIFSKQTTSSTATGAVIPKFWLRDYVPSGCASGWNPEWDIPRVIVINIQLPYSSPSLWAPQTPESDPGFSLISYHVISPALVKALQGRDPATATLSYPALQLLKRLILEGKSAKESTALKVIGMIENIDETNFPDFVKGYNGKPVLVTKSGKISTTGEHSEILDIEFDVRQWSIIARKTLHAMHPKLQEVKCQVGMLIEGKLDEELPEQLLACFGISYGNIMGAVPIEF